VYTLATIFIVLKCVDVINWSWWLVLLPLFLPCLFPLFMLMSAGILGVLTLIDEKLWEIISCK